MALIARTARDRIRACANAGLASVGLRAGIAVVTDRSIGSLRVGASARRRVAGAGDVALIRRDAQDRVRACADARLARVGLRAGVAVVARGSIGSLRIGA